MHTRPHAHLRNGLTSFAGRCGGGGGYMKGLSLPPPPLPGVAGRCEKPALLWLALLGTHRSFDKVFNGPGPLHRARASPHLPGVCRFVTGPTAEPWGTPFAPPRPRLDPPGIFLSPVPPTAAIFPLRPHPDVGFACVSLDAALAPALPRRPHRERRHKSFPSVRNAAHETTTTTTTTATMAAPPESSRSTKNAAGRVGGGVAVGGDPPRPQVCSGVGGCYPERWRCRATLPIFNTHP